MGGSPLIRPNMRRRRLVRFGKFERVAFVDGSAQQKDANCPIGEKEVSAPKMISSELELYAGYYLLALFCWAFLIVLTLLSRQVTEP